MSHKKAQRAHKKIFCWFVLCLFVAPFEAKAETGQRLWLRYEPLPARSAGMYRQRIKSIAVDGNSDTFKILRTELNVGCEALFGTSSIVSHRDDASVVVGLPQTSTLIRKLGWEPELKRLGPEGFRIRTIGNVIVIASTTDVGALYGAFHFLRLLQTEQPIDRLQIDQSPRLKLRLLNHWDNLDGSI